MGTVKFELDQEDAEMLMRLFAAGYTAKRGTLTAEGDDSARRVGAYVDVQTRLGAVAEATASVKS